MTYQLRFALAIWSGVLLIVTAACAPEQTIASNTATAIPSPSATATVPCEQQLVPPEIMEMQPVKPIPGGEIKVIGSGGYIKDTCGGYIEGSEAFKLYLDNELIGDLSCYIDHCEGNFTLPNTLSTGSHCLSVEIGKCQFEFQTSTK